MSRTELKKLLSKIGVKGGKSRSMAKLKAARKNLARARRARKGGK